MEHAVNIVIPLVFIFLIYTGAILVIYFTTYYNADHVPYKNCNAPMGEFALEPSTLSQHTINKCGATNDSQCVNQVTNLEEAVNYCNLYSEICDRFMYNEKSKTVSIVDLKGRLSKSPMHNLYTRQVGISYESQGLDKNAYSSPGLEFNNINATSTNIGINTTTSTISRGSYSSGTVSTGGGGTGGGGY
tara:strand:- start:53 stop:619 length:567 start_codon:yes stop_codon:yes gene_type:complete